VSGTNHKITCSYFTSGDDAGLTHDITASKPTMVKTAE